MVKIFYPETFEMVPASKPHPPNTHYKLSIGVEDWDSNFIPVVKVQMVYDGKVSGRKSPSYPLGTDDFFRVSNTIQEMINNYSLKNKAQ